MTQLLIDVLREPEKLKHLNEFTWAQLLRQARATNLFGRLAHLIEHQASAAALNIPAYVAPHVFAAKRLCTAQHACVQNEAQNIAKALLPLGIQPVLLKGSAYVLGNAPAAIGRMFSDMDILVPRDRLADVESTLMLAGWISHVDDEYDQRYYRQWMHELPPLMHMKRGTGIDVHHALTPLTCRWRADSARMLADAIELPDLPGIKVLQPADQILHSATHLYLESEMPNALRDLSDLDLLLRHHSQHAGFIEQLEQRAQQVGLAKPLDRALRHAHAVFGTPLPTPTLQRLGKISQPVLDALYFDAYRCQHPSGKRWWSPIAQWLLFVRGHWMRMPLPLLVVHLTRKALRREPEAPESK